MCWSYLEENDPIESNAEGEPLYTIISGITDSKCQDAKHFLYWLDRKMRKSSP